MIPRTGSFRWLALACTVGIVAVTEGLFTVEWSTPYCNDPRDGPSYAAYGFPFPYERFSGVSSLHFDFAPHIFWLDMAALPMLPVLNAPEISTPSLFMLGGVAVKKSFVIVAIIVATLALGGIGSWLATRTEPPALAQDLRGSSPSNAVGSLSVSAASARGSEDADVEDLRRRRNELVEQPAVPTNRPLPSNYEISRIGGRVTVNLDGGGSHVAVFGGSGDGRIYAVDPTGEFKEQIRKSLSDADPLPTRRLSGRALDMAGGSPCLGPLFSPT